MFLKVLRIYGIVLYLILCWRLNVNWLYPNFKDFWGDDYYSRVIVIFVLLAVLTISHMFVDIKWQGDDIIDISEEGMVSRSLLTVIGLTLFIFIIDYKFTISLVVTLLKGLT